VRKTKKDNSNTQPFLSLPTFPSSPKKQKKIALMHMPNLETTNRYTLHYTQQGGVEGGGRKIHTSPPSLKKEKKNKTKL